MPPLYPSHLRHRVSGLHNTHSPAVGAPSIHFLQIAEFDVINNPGGWRTVECLSPARNVNVISYDFNVTYKGDQFTYSTGHSNTVSINGRFYAWPKTRGSSGIVATVRNVKTLHKSTAEVKVRSPCRR